MAILDPILSRLRRRLDAVYGTRLERVVLFGSRARGDAKADSDYDVAVFLRNPETFGAEAAKLADIETDILLDDGVTINSLPFTAGSYSKKTGFMENIRRDGIDL